MSFGAVLVIVAAILWGAIGVIAKLIYLTGWLKPLTLSLLRAAFALPVLASFIYLSDRRIPKLSLKEISLFVAFGLLGFTTFQAFYFYALAYTTVGHAATLLYTAPAFVAIMSKLILKERFTNRKIGAVVLGILGAALVVGVLRGEALFGMSTLIGDILAVIAGLGYSTWYIFGKVLGRELGPAMTAFLAIAFGGLILTPIAAMVEGLEPPTTLTLWILVIALGVFPTGISYILYLQGLRILEPTRASVYAILEPISAAIMAYAVFGEVLSLDAAIGALMIIASIILVSERG